MALKWKGRVRETSTTTGVGALTLGGAVTSYGTFASLMSTGDTCYGTVAHRTTTEWEDCLFTMASDGTLQRTTVIDGSSGAGTPVSLSSGTKDVFLGLPPAIVETLLGASLVTLGTASYITSERVLTAGSGISLTDAGAGSTLTVANTAQGVTDHGALTGLADDDHSTVYVSLAPTTDARNVVTLTDTATNTASTPLTIGHNSSNTPLANFGATLAFQLKSSTTTDQLAGAVITKWWDPAHATRTGELSLYVYDVATIREVLRCNYISSTPKVHLPGKLGIGTITNPTAHVHIGSSTFANVQIISAAADGDYSQMAFGQALSSGSYVEIIRYSNATTGNQGNGLFILGNYSKATLITQSTTFRRDLYITSGGLVGMGTTTGTDPVTRLEVAENDAATNSVTNVVTISHNTSGTAAAGFGSGLAFRLESSTTADQSAGLISCSWTDATHASRASRLSASVYYTSTAEEGWRVDANSDGNARTYVPYRLVVGSTTATSAVLSVRNSTAATVWVLCNVSATNYAQMIFGEGTGAGQYAQFIRYSNATTGTDGGGTYFVANEDKDLCLSTDYAAGYRRDLYINTTAGWVGLGMALSTAPSARLHVRETDAYAGAVTTAMILERDASSGTPAAGDGLGVDFRLKSSTTAGQTAAKITCSWGVATHASREGILSLYGVDYGGDRLGFQVTGDGTNTEIGFYGVTPVARPAALVQTYSTADRTHANFTAADLTVADGAGTNDATIGAITADASVIAAVQELADQHNKLKADLADLKQFVNSLVDDLQQLGLAQ